jgi:hypothetical protein
VVKAAHQYLFRSVVEQDASRTLFANTSPFRIVMSTCHGYNCFKPQFICIRCNPLFLGPHTRPATYAVRIVNIMDSMLAHLQGSCQWERRPNLQLVYEVWARYKAACSTCILHVGISYSGWKGAQVWSRLAR